MRGVLIWVGGLGASAVLNGGLVLALAAAVAPDPAPQSPPPEAAFDIASYPVPQAEAREADSGGTDLPPGAAGGVRSGGAAVPQSRAAAVDVAGQTALAVAPQAVVAEPVPGAPPVAPVAAPGAGVTSAPVASTAVTPVAMPAATVAPAVAAGATVAPATVAVPAVAPIASAADTVTSVVAAQPAMAALAAPNSVVPRVTGAGVRVAPVQAAQPAQRAAVATVPVMASTLADPDVITQLRPSAQVAGAVTLAAVVTVPVTTSTLARPDVVTQLRPSAQVAGAVTLAAAPMAEVPSVAEPLGTTSAAGTSPVAQGPDATELGATAPSGVTLAPNSPGGAPVAAAVADAPNATAVAPPSERQQAALAWSGGGAAALDDVSLAAIQAFSRAGDPSGSGPRVRDGITALLAQVPCARLQTVFDPDTGALELRGHIPDDGLRGPVLAALANQVGGAIPLQDTVMILPRPQCGALAQIEDVGLAQSSDQQGDPRVVGDQPFAAVSRFSEGEQLAFQVQGPDYPAYIYVDYFDADGQVIHLQPNELVPLRPVAPDALMPIGLGADGLPAIDIRVSPPFGQEIMVTFASTVPLYDGTRPLIEPAGPYLAFLKARVAQAQAEDPGFRGEWYYFFVSTRAAP